MTELPRPENDGTTHINVYSKANTDLGRFLSNFSGPPVDTDDGTFRTVEGYWQWLRTPEDWAGREAFREADGWEAKRLSKRVKDECEDRPKVDRAFKRKIGRAILDKILKSGYTDAFAESELPFEHYYVFGDRQVRGSHQWLMGVLEHIREIVAEHADT
jgi:hypothetical protein